MQLHRRATPQGAARVGFTVTKKVGNAVLRNRIRRRLREAARTVAPDAWPEGHDAVLIAREAAASLPFEALVARLDTALRQAARKGRVAKETGTGHKPRRTAGRSRDAAAGA